MSSPSRYRSKTWATWLAVLGGTVGLHRLYLKGLDDVLAWLHLVPTVLGLAGVVRWRQLGQDDQAAWLLMPILGLMISQAMLHGIVYGLTSDEKWDLAYNPGQRQSQTAWGPIMGVITALLVGAAVLMSTLAFGIQKFFEWDLDRARVTQVSTKLPR